MACFLRQGNGINERLVWSGNNCYRFIETLKEKVCNFMRLIWIMGPTNNTLKEIFEAEKLGFLQGTKELLLILSNV